MSQVFISYCHKDNKLPPNWVNSFHELLADSIIYYGGESKVWIDKENMQIGNHDIPESIEKELKESDILLAIISGFYFNDDHREWVDKERHIFQKRWGDKAKNKIVFIEKIQIDQAKIDTNLQGLKRFKFYYHFGDKKTPYHFKPEEAEFGMKIAELAEDINQSITGQKTTLADTSANIVYITETPELSNEKQDLVKELKRNKCHVISNLLEYGEQKTIVDLISENNQKKIYIVMLIGIYPNFSSSKENKSVLETQYDLIKKLNPAKGNVQILMKIPSQVEIQSQIENITSEKKTIENFGIDKITTNINELEKVLPSLSLDELVAKLMEVLGKLSADLSEFFQWHLSELEEKIVDIVDKKENDLTALMNHIVNDYVTYLDEQLITIDSHRKFIGKIRNDLSVDGFFDPMDKPYIDFKLHVLEKIKQST